MIYLINIYIFYFLHRIAHDDCRRYLLLSPCLFYHRNMMRRHEEHSYFRLLPPIHQMDLDSGEKQPVQIGDSNCVVDFQIVYRELREHYDPRKFD